VSNKKRKVELDATGNCYEDSAWLVMDPLDRSYTDWTLVHGRPVLQRPPFIRYGHAWVERGGYVFDPSVGVTMPTDAYYALGKITEDEMYRYTAAEARLKLVEHKHWGPWEGVESNTCTWTETEQ
jgi:hypothetical protein